MHTIKPSEFIESVIQVIPTEDKWTKNSFARDNENNSVYAISGNATCWCMLGAVRKSCDNHKSQSVVPINIGTVVNECTPFIHEAIRKAMGFVPMGGIATFNDDFAESHKQVLEVLQDAKQLAIEHEKKAPLQYKKPTLRIPPNAAA